MAPLGSEADSNYTIEWCGVVMGSGWMGGWMGCEKWRVESRRWVCGMWDVGRRCVESGVGRGWRWNCSRLGCEMSVRVVCGVEW